MKLEITFAKNAMATVCNHLTGNDAITPENVAKAVYEALDPEDYGFPDLGLAIPFEAEPLTNNPDGTMSLVLSITEDKIKVLRKDPDTLASVLQNALYSYYDAILPRTKPRETIRVETYAPR